MVKKLICLTLILTALGAWAADTGNAVLTDRVRSLQLRSVYDQFPMAGDPSVVIDDPGDAVIVSFDVLGDDRNYLRYELVHCNADWQPSALAYIEYLDGFNEGTIDDYAYSGPTSVHYVHYTLTLPNEQTRITRSGNYLLRIYDESDGPDRPWLQCRFTVSEQSASLGANITSRTDVDFNRAHQQLELDVDVSQAGVRDVFNDLTVVVEQNGRPDTRRVITKPLSAIGKRLTYAHVPELIFRGGSEYRRFETVSTNFTPMGVDHVQWQAPYYHFVLEPAQSRAGEHYHYDETLSGAYVVREYNAGSSSDVDADYAVVHFALEYPYTPGFDFYIDGDFTQRRFSPEARLTWNAETGRYERAMLLKQGAYSYQILAVAPGTSAGRTDVIEGDHYETRNDYTVSVYTRAPADRADRLIAVRRFSFR